MCYYLAQKLTIFTMYYTMNYLKGKVQLHSRLDIAIRFRREVIWR